MPNWVPCYINFSGEEKAVQRVLDTISGKDECKNKSAFDFNTLIPMPECLSVESGSMSYLAYAYYMVKIHSKLPTKRSSFYKSKADVIERVERNLSISSQEMLELGKQLYENEIKYGSIDWYDWCCSNWGTKWNACESSRNGTTICFRTAWSWPEPIMQKLAELCGELGVEFEGKWADEDCGNNAGYFYFDGGTDSVLDYDYYDSCSSDAYEAYIDCWGESECIGRDDNGAYYHYECGESCPNNCQ